MPTRKQKTSQNLVCIEKVIDTNKLDIIIDGNKIVGFLIHFL